MFMQSAGIKIEHKYGMAKKNGDKAALPCPCVKNLVPQKNAAALKAQKTIPEIQ